MAFEERLLQVHRRSFKRPGTAETRPHEAGFLFETLFYFVRQRFKIYTIPVRRVDLDKLTHDIQRLN